MRSPLVLATANPHKREEFRWLLRLYGFAVAAVEPTAALGSVEEGTVSYSENATTKAVAVAQATGSIALGDDTGLEVDALDGQPGVLSARYAGPTANAVENRQKLLGQLQDVPPQRRGARFVCHITLAGPSGELIARASGSCRGIILEEPLGREGFGYDSLLLIPEYHRTLAELPNTARWLISHRGRAVQALARVR